jgi:hypothetical protein
LFALRFALRDEARRITYQCAPDGRHSRWEDLKARSGANRTSERRAAYEAAGLDAEISRRILEGYQRIPQSTPDERGDVEAWAAGTAARLHRRLDEEERAAGHGPW